MHQWATPIRQQMPGLKASWGNVVMVRAVEGGIAHCRRLEQTRAPRAASLVLRYPDIWQPGRCPATLTYRSITCA